MTEFKLTDEQAEALIDDVKANVKKTKDGQPHSWTRIIESAVRVGLVVPAEKPQPYLSYWPEKHSVQRADGMFKCSCGSQASDINMTHEPLPQHVANHRGEPVCQRMVAWHDGATKCMNPRWAHQGLGHEFQEVL